MWLLLLSHFSHVRLCVTPQTAAHQAHLSLGFSRQKYWMGCHFLLQCMKVKSEREVAQSYSTLCDTMDCSLPGSSVYGIFQARVLEWDAIALSSLCGSIWQHSLICLNSPFFLIMYCQIRIFVFIKETKVQFRKYVQKTARSII